MQSAPKDKEDVGIPRLRAVSRPSSPARSRPSSPAASSTPHTTNASIPDLGLGNLGLGADTSMEGNMAPDNVEMHHEQPEMQILERVEDLGAGQTGAETEITKVSAKSEQEQVQ